MQPEKPQIKAQEQLIKQRASSDSSQNENIAQNVKTCENNYQNTQQDFQNINQYRQYFADVDQHSFEIKSKLRYIKDEFSNFYKNLTIFNVQHSKNYEIVIIQLRLGSFSTKLNIISSNQKSPFHSCRQAGFGSFGDIYTISTNNIKYKDYQRYAIKCFPLYKQNRPVPQLTDILKQIFIIKLANQIDEIYHSDEFIYFDLVYYTDCLQLSMQKLGWNEKEFQKRQKDLKQSLSTFHKIGIVHCDIKNDNIAFNNYINKWVFIDFGLSLFIEENVQQKTQTKFIGNYKNSSPEMKEIYKDKQKGFVNLYFNDYYALKQTLVDLKQDQRDKLDRLQDTIYQSISQQILQKITLFLFVTKFKFYLYGLSIDNQKICNMFSYLSQKNDEKMTQIIKNFMSQVKFSTVCKVIYENYFKVEQNLHLFNKNKVINYENAEEVALYQNRFSAFLQNKEINISAHFNKNYIEQTLLDQLKLKSLDKQLYFTNLLQFISFTSDKYRKSTLQKSLVCQVFNRIYSNIKQSTTSNIYQPVHQTLVFLLNYCLNPPFTHWKKTHLFNILTQSFLLGLGCDENLDRLIDFFKNNCNSTAQQAFMLYLLYQHFAWDNNLLTKSQNKQMIYVKVVQRLRQVLSNLGIEIEQRMIIKHTIQRNFRKKINTLNQFENYLILGVDNLIKVSIRQKFDEGDRRNQEIVNFMLKISSTDAFVQLYSEQIYKAYLNLGLKMIDSSFIKSKQAYKALLVSQQNEGQIKYYYFNVINALKKLKQSKLALSLLQKWKANINDNTIWQNSMISYFLIEQITGQEIQNPKYSVLLRKQIDNLHTREYESIRTTLNVFKFIEIFSFLANNMAQKQYVFIKNKCRRNYYDFMKNYGKVMSIQNMKKQLNVAYIECIDYFKEFEKILDWITFRYLIFISNKLMMLIQLFGRYLGVPLIMRSYNFFFIFLRCTQKYGISTRTVQNNYLYFINFLIEKTKRKESIDEIIQSYYEIKRQFQAQFVNYQSFIHKKKYQDSEFFNFIYNIDFLILKEIQLTQNTSKVNQKNYPLQIILKINISILKLLRKYDRIGCSFARKTLQSNFFKKIFNIQLQLSQATLYKRQIIALYVEYIGNFYATFNKLLSKVVQLENIDVSQYKNYIEIYFTQKVINLKKLLKVTDSYCLIRYFRVWKSQDILFFKLLFREIILEQTEIDEKLVQFINIISQVYDNKQSWRQFFLLKQIFQFDSVFTQQKFLTFTFIIVKLKHNGMNRQKLFNNEYRLMKFFSTLLCSLIDCLQTNRINNMQLIVQISPILQATSFQCILFNHPMVIELIKIQQKLIQNLTLSDRIQIFPFLLMIAINKTKLINLKVRYKMYLQKKMIKGLIVNDSGNLFITYCKNYLNRCQQIHKQYFRHILYYLKDMHNIHKKLLKIKIQNYYPTQSYTEYKPIKFLFFQCNNIKSF